MKKILALSGFFFSTSFLFAQKYLTITEHDVEHPDKVHTNAFISDINSTLDISIDKSALFNKLAASGDYKVPEGTANMLSYLHEVLQKQSEMLATVKQALATYNPSDPVQADKFNATMKSFALFARSIFKKDPITDNYYQNLPVMDLYGGIFTAVNQRVNELEKGLEQQNTQSSKSLQLGAWLQAKNIKTPVHLDGFDTNPNQEYYEVNRWQIIPTADQLQQFKDLQTYAKDNKDVGLDAIKTVLQKNVTALINDFNSIIQNTLADINTEYDKIKTQVNDAGVTAAVAKVQSSYQDLVSSIQPAIDKYKQLLAGGKTNIDALVQNFGTDLPLFTAKAIALKTDLETVITKVNALAPAIEAKDFVTALKNKLSTITLSLDGTSLQTLYKGVQVDESTLVFTNKVLSLSFSGLPSSTTLNLNNTGVRNNGDQVIFLLREYDAETQKAVNLDFRTVTLYLIVPHIYGTVGVVLAHPYGTTAIVNHFQMLPSYNFLVKGVWPWTQNYYRKSNIRNTLTDFSFGLHIGAPDFNKDDVPEIGLGIVISAIHDYLQVGFANNLFHGNWYWFLGIHLPVPSFGLTGSTGGGTTKTNLN